MKGQADGTMLVKDINVVDTCTGLIQQDVSVLIIDRRIHAIVFRNESAPLTETVIDGRGLFLIPGYLDMHAHTLDDEERDDSLALMLAHGITGWRQMSGSPEHLAARRMGALHLKDSAPELLAMPGTILTFANAPDPDAAIHEVRKQKAEGADFIKTISLDRKTFFAALEEANRLGMPYAGHLSPGVDAELAAKAGMRAIEHLGPADLQLISCSTRQWLIRLILKLKPPKPMRLAPQEMATIGRVAVANPTLLRLHMDSDALSKTQSLIDSFSERKARQLAEACVAHGTWQVPTLIRLATMQFGYEMRYREHPELLRYVPQQKRAFWETVAAQYETKLKPGAKETLRQLMALELRLTKIFDECGVKMMVGTDYGGGLVVPGVAIHQEFALLEEAGLMPLRILQMTTIEAARFLGRDSELGSVAAGKNADLVLLSANPLERAANLGKIVGVIRDGHFFDAAKLKGLKATVAAHAGLADSAH